MGPFDLEKLKKTLLCKACKVIKEEKMKASSQPQLMPLPTMDTRPPEQDKSKFAPLQKEAEKPKVKDNAKEKPKEKEKDMKSVE